MNKVNKMKLEEMTYDLRLTTYDLRLMTYDLRLTNFYLYKL
jgi:hypothetical protein